MEVTNKRKADDDPQEQPEKKNRNEQEVVAWSTRRTRDTRRS